MAEISGFNPGNVTELRDKVNTTAQEAGKGIVETLHSDFVVPMSQAWYTKTGVDYFSNQFHDAVKETGTSIQEVFDNFRQNLQTAADNWAGTTGGENITLGEIEAVELDVNVSDMQPKNGQGDEVINEEEATSIANNLTQVEETIKSNLNSLASNLTEASQAFLGHSQDKAIEDCFVQVTNIVADLFKFLTEGDNSVQSAINKAVEVHQETAEANASGFNSASGN